ELLVDLSFLGGRLDDLLVEVAKAEPFGDETTDLLAARAEGARDADNPSHLFASELLHSLLDHLVEVLRRPERLRDEIPKGIALHREQGRRTERAHGRHPRRIAKDRHLAEELSGREPRERPRIAVLLVDDLHLAVDDDEEPVCGIALRHDHLAVLDLQR